MKVQIGRKSVFFDVEGPEFVLEGTRLKKLPTLILIHGAPGNSDHSVFKPAFSCLRDTARIVYLDLSGAGRSDDEPDDIFSLNRWADDLVAFCNKLDIDKPIVLGVSGGGFVAMAYGIKHPDHAGKLILASTQAKLNTDRAIKEFGRLGDERCASAAKAFLTNPLGTESTRAFNLHCTSVYNTTPQPPRETIIFRAKLASAFHDQGGIWHEMDLRDQLHNIKAPTLVLTGTDDPITPLQDSLDIANRLTPGIMQLGTIQDAGHGPWRDKPEETFALLRKFISGS